MGRVASWVGGMVAWTASWWRVVLGRWNQRHLQYWRCPGRFTSRCVEAVGPAVLLLRRGEELMRRWSYTCRAGGLSRAWPERPADWGTRQFQFPDWRP